MYNCIDHTCKTLAFIWFCAETAQRTHSQPTGSTHSVVPCSWPLRKSVMRPMLQCVQAAAAAEVCAHCYQESRGRRRSAVAEESCVRAGAECRCGKTRKGGI
jgi:hypothetical protein